MKIVVTGSLGHISRPLTEALVQKGHAVTVISSTPKRRKEIEALGAAAAIGTMEDADFLTATFTDADAVYCMIAAHNYFDANFDLMTTASSIAHNYKQAIQQTDVKRVIHLSSIGAHTDKNNGILRFHHLAENILRELPADVAIKHLRPVAFYYNLYGFVDTIKRQGVMASNYGADDQVPWVSPLDIAAVAAEEIVTPFKGRTIHYIASDEPTCNKIASTLGAAIGQPDLQWIVIPDEQMQNRMIAAGMNPVIAEGLVKMQASMHTGELFEDYYRNRPVLGPIKIEDFAEEFAMVFNQ
ncbi:MAG: NAD(P)H-binding protein [Anaerolineae bacterium]|nr:NAD(P)H-binding protein [Anaerolineae bacterium]